MNEPALRAAAANVETGTDLEGLAAFLSERALEQGTAEEQAKMAGLLAAYRDPAGKAVRPEAAEDALRWQGLAFKSHPDYRAEWKPGR